MHSDGYWKDGLQRARVGRDRAPAVYRGLVQVLGLLVRGLLWLLGRVVGLLKSAGRLWSEQRHPDEATLRVEQIVQSRPEEGGT